MKIIAILYTIIFLFAGCSTKDETLPKIKEEKNIIRHYECIDQKDVNATDMTKVKIKTLHLEFNPNWTEKQKRIHLFLHKRKHKITNCKEIR